MPLVTIKDCLEQKPQRFLDAQFQLEPTISVTGRSHGYTLLQRLTGIHCSITAKIHRTSSRHYIDGDQPSRHYRLGGGSKTHFSSLDSCPQDLISLGDDLAMSWLRLTSQPLIYITRSACPDLRRIKRFVLYVLCLIYLSS